MFPWALLVGQRFYGEPEKAVRASCEGDFIRSYGEESGYARWWGGSRTPAAVDRVAARTGAARRDARRRAGAASQHLDEVTPKLAEFVNRRIFGAFEYRIDVAAGRAREPAPGGRLPQGRRRARRNRCCKRCSATTRALHETQRYYAARLADARLLTPSPLINRGVVWAKANMLRVIKEYPQGWGSTNSPPSDILVSRDTSWFVHGFDYFWPEFSRNAIEVFNRWRRTERASGRVRARRQRLQDDRTTSTSTTTRRFTSSRCCTTTTRRSTTRGCASVYPLVRQASPTICSRSATPTDWSTARPSGVDMYGITSWRNIIPYYTLDGAVTEINAEAYYALEAAAMLARVVRATTSDWERYGGEAHGACARR